MYYVDMLPPLNSLGNKICIIGCSSTGKSTLADRLSKQLGLPVTHLDFLAHETGSNWVRRPNDQLILAHQKILQEPGWIIEGNYSVTMKERFEAATSVIWLDSNRFTAVLRYCIRSFKNDLQRIGRLPGAKAEWKAFMFKQILWVYPKNRQKYEKILQQYPHLLVVKLRGMKAVRKAWVPN